MRSNEIGQQFFNNYLSPLKAGTILALLHSDKNLPIFKQDLKGRFKSLENVFTVQF